MHFSKTPIILLICFLGLGVYLRWELLDHVLVTQWNLRDFDRALSLFDGDYIKNGSKKVGRLKKDRIYEGASTSSSKCLATIKNEYI